MLMKTVYTNGNIYTVLPEGNRVNTVVVDDGRFVYVGDASGYAKADGDTVIDLGGRFVLPGIIDAHQHWAVPCTNAGRHANYCPIFTTPTIEAALDQMKQFVSEYPDYPFYKCIAGWKENWSRTLNRYDLDEVCPDKPFLVHDGGAHSVTSNSKMLELLGLTKDSPDPAPGHSYYGRDENGELTGLATEWAQIAFHEALSTVTHEDIVENVRSLIDYNASRGITGIYDAGSLTREEEFLDIIKEMDDAGELKCRLSLSYTIFLQYRLKDAVKKHLAFKEKYESENIIMDTIKLFLDGTSGEYSAYLLQPYRDRDTCGAPMPTPEQFYELMKDVNAAGLNIHMHTIGDAAAKLIIDTMERMMAEGIEIKSKIIIAHMELIRDEELAKLKDYGIYVNVTPHWATGLGNPVKETLRLPEELYNRIYRYNTYWKTGVNVSFGADSTILPGIVGDESWSPYYGWEIGMTRLQIGDTDESHVDHLDERLTLEQMIKG